MLHNGFCRCTFLIVLWALLFLIFGRAYFKYLYCNIGKFIVFLFGFPGTEQFHAVCVLIKRYGNAVAGVGVLVMRDPNPLVAWYVGMYSGHGLS